MSDERKPRDFWVWKNKDFSFDLGFEKAMIAEYPHKDSLEHTVHVIEYSAYEAEKKRADELAEWKHYYEKKFQAGVFLTNDEYVKTRSHIESLRSALEFYASIHPDKPSAALCVDKFDMARKSLAADDEAKNLDSQKTNK